MQTYLTKFRVYNFHELKNYTTKTPMTGNWFQCISLIMHLGKILYATFFNHEKEDPNLFGLTIIL